MMGKEKKEIEFLWAWWLKCRGKSHEISVGEVEGGNMCAAGFRKSR